MKTLRIKINYNLKRLKKNKQLCENNIGEIIKMFN